MSTLTQKTSQVNYWKFALWLAIFTVFYNIAEGLISIFFGISDEALTLFGFGVDSFIEVMSGIGILAMVIRIQRNPDAPRSGFEITALRVTGTSFYLLGIGLGASAIYNLFTAHKPETTLPGLIISIISIGVMWLLVAGKRKVGRALNSVPILADANCTLVCIYMSVILLISSLVYELTGFGFVDSIGALGLIYFSVKEGREAFDKAKGIECDCEDENCKD
ncbi:MAG: cation transporter [Anaerolineales bacterium]|nr:cation transporter [Anaerolineales bacterium]MBK8821165.1 cation transporter [Anaerolineales bacterium]